MNESVKAVLDNYNGFKEECKRITSLLVKNPRDSYDRYLLDTFYPKKVMESEYYEDEHGMTRLKILGPIIKIHGLLDEYGCRRSADFPVELFDMTDEEIISWRKENLGY